MKQAVLAEAIDVKPDLPAQFAFDRFYGVTRRHAAGKVRRTGRVVVARYLDDDGVVHQGDSVSAILKMRRTSIVIHGLALLNASNAIVTQIISLCSKGRL